MKVKSFLTIGAILAAALTANAQVVVKQTMNIAGRVIVDSANGKTTAIERANYRDFITIITNDMGYPLDDKQLRTSKFVTFDFGDGLEGLFVEFWDAASRSWLLLDVSDRFDYFFVSDVSGDYFSAGGRWATIIEIDIELVSDDIGDFYAEFYGVGIFQGSVRTFRRNGIDIQIPTAGLRSSSFPAILDLSVDAFSDETPADLTIAFRSTTVIFDDQIIINPIIEE